MSIFGVATGVICQTIFLSERENSNFSNKSTKTTSDKHTKKFSTEWTLTWIDRTRTHFKLRELEPAYGANLQYADMDFKVEALHA